MIFDDSLLARKNPREFAWNKLLIDDLRSARGNMVSENAVLGRVDLRITFPKISEIEMAFSVCIPCMTVRNESQVQVLRNT